MAYKKNETFRWKELTENSSKGIFIGAAVVLKGWSATSKMIAFLTFYHPHVSRNSIKCNFSPNNRNGDIDGMHAPTNYTRPTIVGPGSILRG